MFAFVDHAQNKIDVLNPLKKNNDIATNAMMLEHTK
jgi:hypothetical protein